MDLETAKERLLKAIDFLHPNLGIDALRLAEAIDDLIVARLKERSADSAGTQPK